MRISSTLPKSHVSTKSGTAIQNASFRNCGARLSANREAMKPRTYSTLNPLGRTSQSVTGRNRNQLPGTARTWALRNR